MAVPSTIAARRKRVAFIRVVLPEVVGVRHSKSKLRPSSLP
jgi:hypothetical protein